MSVRSLRGGVGERIPVSPSHNVDPLACSAANAKLEKDEELTRDEAQLCVIWQMADDKAFRAITLGWLKRDTDIWLAVGEPA